MPRTDRVKEAVGETDRQKARQRRGIPRAQRPQGARHRALRLALTVQRPGLDHPVGAAQVDRPQHKNQTGQTRRDQPGHAMSTRSAKSAPTAGKLSSAATAPPISAKAVSSPA